MVGVCAAMLGVEKEKVISVSTNFGPEGPAEDAARRRLEATSTSRWVARLPASPASTAVQNLMFDASFVSSCCDGWLADEQGQREPVLFFLPAPSGYITDTAPILSR